MILFKTGNGSRERQDHITYENIGARGAEIGEDEAQTINQDAG
ncbi:MAG TPA: hypothetical protein VFQ36_17330 [Ktedonobacteraceae bacterium]|nr:hypothetical protein [Ktedonobacteraceae bacterium]